MVLVVLVGVAAVVAVRLPALEGDLHSPQTPQPVSRHEPIQRQRASHPAACPPALPPHCPRTGPRTGPALPPPWQVKSTMPMPMLIVVKFSLLLGFFCHWIGLYWYLLATVKTSEPPWLLADKQLLPGTRLASRWETAHGM